MTLYSTRGRVTRPRSINYATWLRLNLGHRLLVFALTTNLESGPRFADICWTVSYNKMSLYWFSPVNRFSGTLSASLQTVILGKSAGLSEVNSIKEVGMLEFLTTSNINGIIQGKAALLLNAFKTAFFTTSWLPF